MSNFKAMSLVENIRKCVPRKHGLSRKCTKVIFNVKISKSFKSLNIPSQIRDLLVYIAREGVAVTDLFRRPGNAHDLKKIIADLQAGRQVNWSGYNFYTLANIAKRYLLHIDGGILGPESEETLLGTLDIPDDQTRIEAMHKVIISQPKPVKQLLALLFGIWFRMTYHTEVNTMSVEAVAKSVAGSIFPSCTTTPPKVERASKVMEYLITGFASAELFSRELIEYFTFETKTSISRIEKFKYEFRFPKDEPREKSVRLFMRMLMEEGKIHGFHLIYDAVSKEVFEKACCGDRESGGSQEANEDSASENNAVALRNNDSNQRFLLSSSSTQPFPGDPILNMDSSSTLTPTILTRKHNFRTGVVTPLDAPIQQTSEKRTCVTTTSLMDDSNSPYDQNKTTYDVTTVPTSSTITLQQAKDLSRTNWMCSTGVQPIGVTFTAVKKRQLERLQKRSDWFLSPPAGSKSTNLMHLDPTSLADKQPDQSPECCSPTLDTSRLQPIPKSNQSMVVYDNLDRYVDDDDDDDDDDQLKNSVRIASNKLRTFDDNVVDVGSGDMLEHMAPSVLWSVTKPQNSHFIKPNIASSPNYQSNQSCFAFQRGLDEKENYPEVETRYYVVERYYGPEPRPSSYAMHHHSREQQLQRFKF